VVRVELLEIL
jgi:hypothetical protein